ncbi:hypothetical protein [Sphingomonas sp. CARO-RG-8B-R24-01]|uniref:hypothetical protein n=1 Tax=Sphingomonas sp. CARO-RG-8B-R24-01 TaxID=2914831 RepID=UPI001F59FD96|nr:hypothetical protein [Sphingomonas sp. CARO-RG-8B-R24-01]
MAASTAAGSSLAICIGAPATNDAAGFAALTFTEIGGLEKVGAVGAVFSKIEFQPLFGPKQKYKGPADYGSLQPSLAHDESDAGQSILRAAADDETNKLFAFALTYSSGAKRFFQGRVFGYPETTDGADTILMAAPTIEISTKVVKVAAGAPSPDPPTMANTRGTSMLRGAEVSGFIASFDPLDARLVALGA